jgi:hypothetical protein
MPLPVSTNFDPHAERMRKLRAPQDLIAKLSGLPAMAISRAVNHQEDLSYADWRRVEAIIADLEELVRRSGVLLDWRNHEALKAKIAELESERQSPPEFPSERDYKLLRAISAGIGFSAVAEEMGCEKDELFELLEVANKRFAYQTVRMSQWTEARKAHSDIIQKEMVDRSRQVKQIATK